MSIRVYNCLVGADAEFAKEHGLPIKEYAVRAKGCGRRPDDPVSKVAGNHTFGFPHKRMPKDAVRFEVTVDGQGLRKARKSIVKPRKNPSRLWTTFEVSGNKERVAHNSSLLRKDKRKSQRNRKASYGRKAVTC